MIRVKRVNIGQGGRIGWKRKKNFRTIGGVTFISIPLFLRFPKFLGKKYWIKRCGGMRIHCFIVALFNGWKFRLRKRKGGRGER